MAASKRLMDGRLDPRPGLDFLFTEIRCGMAFAKIARDAQPSESDKAERNLNHARIAYNTVLKFRPRVRIGPAAEKALDEQLQELCQALRELGEAI